MKKKKSPAESAEPRIVNVRGQRVILDADLAEMYGVATKVLNQAVKRNAARFPSDFAFQLTAKEFADLRSQVAIPILQGATGSEVTPNWSQIVTLKTGRGSKGAVGEANSSQIVMSSRRGRAYRPWAFTEHGALMTANILRSKRAVQMSVYVVRAFVRQREHLMASAEVLKRMAEIDRTLLEHDQSLQFIWRQIEPLLNPPDPQRPKIGFQP